MFRRLSLASLIALAVAPPATAAPNFKKPTSPALIPTQALAGPAGLSRVVTFTEGSGSTLGELAGGNNFTMKQAGATAAFGWNSDPTYGGYITFNGTNQYATAIDTGMPSGSASKTFSFLFRTTNSAANNIIGAYGTSGANWMDIGYLASGQYTLSDYGQGGPQSGNVNNGAWHIGTVVLANAGGTSFNIYTYVDGALAASNGPYPAGRYNTALSGTMAIGWGAGTTSQTTGFYYTGDVAGVWAWNSALTAAQVASHYNAPWQMVGGAQPPGNAFSSTQAGNWSDVTSAGPWGPLSVYPWQKQAISSIAASPTGAIRVTLSGPSYGPNPGWASGFLAYVENVGGTAEANAPGGTIASKRWAVNAVDPSHLDLKLALVNTYGAAGTVTRISDSYASNVKAVASDGSGGILVTLTGLGTPTAWAAGQKVAVAGVGADVNGTWIVNAIGTANAGVDATIVLASVFANAYTSGGTISRDDTITINHAVVADATVQGGNDINTAFELNLSSPAATLTIGAGATVTARTNVGLNGGTIALRKNSGLLLGAAVNGPVQLSPVGVVSLVKTTTDATAPSAGNRATLGVPPTPAIASNSWYVPPLRDSGQFSLAYANVTGGTGSQPMLGRDTNYTTDAIWQFDHCAFNACGGIGTVSQWAAASASTGAGTYSFTYCTWTNSLNAPLYWNANLARAGAATTRQIRFCYFDIAPNFNGSFKDTTIEDSVFNAGYGFASGMPSVGDVTSCTRNLFRYQANTYLGMIAVGSMTDCYHLITEQGQGNALFMIVPTAFGVTMLRCTYDAPFLGAMNGNTPDCFYQYATGTSGLVYRSSYCLILPVAVGWSGDTPAYNARGTMSGNLQSAQYFPAGNVKIRLDHNTACCRTTTQAGWQTVSGTSTGPYVNETTPDAAHLSAAGTLDWHRDNLMWDDSSGSGNYGWATITNAGFGTGNDNTLTPANCKNNAFYHMQTAAGFTGKTNNGTYYATPTTGTAPGANDVTLSASPNFVDPTRSFVTWGRMIQGLVGRTAAQAPADVESAIALFSHMNDDSGSTPGVSVSALNAWVRAGWAPRNTALKAKASDGTDIGAIPGTFGVKVPIIDRRRKVGAAPAALPVPVLLLTRKAA